MKKNTSVSFLNQDIYVGIDVHLRSWKVVIISGDIEVKRFSMNPDADKLIQHLRFHYPDANIHLAYEAGFSGFAACRKFQSAGMSCIVVNPADIPTAHKEKTYKTDQIDAAKIARELSHGHLQGIYVPSLLIENFRQLVRRRLQIVQSRTRVKNRIKNTLHYKGISIPEQFKQRCWSKAFIRWLKTSDKSRVLNHLFEHLLRELDLLQDLLNEIDSQIRECIETHQFKKEIDLIRSTPGIGEVSSWILYSEIMDIKRFKRAEQLNSYAGLVPSCYNSGDTTRSSGLTFRRNKHIRNVMIESAWVAVRKDPALLSCFNQLCTRMQKNKAIIRIAKKLLNRIRHVWLEHEHYQCAVIE